jgi:hypothetical protein
LAGFEGWANLPYFRKQGDIWAYSPQEPKKEIIQGFLVCAELSGKETKPILGLFSIRVQTQ